MRSRISLFVVGLGHGSSKEGRDAMLMSDMVSRFIIEARKVRLEMYLGSRKFVRISDNGRIKRILHHHPLVLLHLEDKVRIMARIPSTIELDQQNLKEVWHIEVVEVLHVLSVVEPTKEFPKNMQSSGNPGKKSQCSSVARQERVAPRGATTCINGGANCLYSITTRQEQENSINVVTISGDGIRVDTQKIEAVKSFPRPTSPTDIRSFLDLSCYYRMFVEGFSSISSPLAKMTQKTVKFQLC
ncbi:uncharacterized protein [Solanum lycopersicum]|uniref:uncharacterized protein n=1 Tax=Solanum lycopersicum TaxID=4081 RepID=UPI003748CBEE